MIRRVEFGSAATSKVLKGLDIVADAVKVTFGPAGKNVIYEDVEGKPAITKDGVTVAHNIELEDSIENLGATLIKDVAKKTVKEVGDGTSTSTILAQALIKEGVKAIQYGENPILIKREIDHAVSLVVEHLRKNAIPVAEEDMAYKVALTSTNNDESLASLVTEAVKNTAYSPDAIINVSPSSSELSYVESVRGIELNRGYEDQSFMRDGHVKLQLEEPFIVIKAGKITDREEIFPYMQEAKQEGRPLIIVATELSVTVRDTVKYNHTKGYQDIIYIKMLGLTPVQRESIEDLASLVGKSLQDSPIAFGRLASAVVERNNTSLTPTADNSIDKRVEHIQALIDNIPDEYEQSRYKERIAKLRSQVATIYLASASEAEYSELSDRIDDAVHAVQSAVEHGIVIGGGIPLAMATNSLSLPIKGHLIVAEACKAPLKLVYANSEIKPSGILSTLNHFKSKTQGFDVVSGERIDFIKAGIIDPVQVPIAALTNAASIAGMFLTTGCVIASKEFEV